MTVQMTVRARNLQIPKDEDVYQQIPKMRRKGATNRGRGISSAGPRLRLDHKTTEIKKIEK
jgi:hypothetical protein